MLAIDHLTYDEVISNIAKVVEAIRALIMVIGGLWAFLNFGIQTLYTDSRSGRKSGFDANSDKSFSLGWKS